MPRNTRGTLLSGKKLQQGNIGNMFVFGVVALMVGAGAVAVNGLEPKDPPTNAEAVKIVTPTPDSSNTPHDLQLQTFGFVTLAPTPPTVGDLCQSGGVNNEPEILVGFEPSSGQVASATGQIKVWVSDEGAPFVAPNEQVDNATGQVITPGDRTAKAADGFLYEPALYISPDKAENGGKPHFPDLIKGNYNNTPPDRGNGVQGAKMDPSPSSGNSFFMLDHNAEYIWNVSSLGLASGDHQAEFVIHDGDRDRGVGCVNIQIQ